MGAVFRLNQEELGALVPTWMMARLRPCHRQRLWGQNIRIRVCMLFLGQTCLIDTSSHCAENTLQLSLPGTEHDEEQ